MWPLELGIWTPTLSCVSLICGYGLLFVVAPHVGDLELLGFDVPP